MQSNNPVFRRSEEFSRAGAAHQGYGQSQYDGYQTPPSGYGDTVAPTAPERMTVDSVVQKTALTLGLVILTAAATWILTGPIDEGAAPGLIGALTIGSLGAFALSMVNSFKKVISPALVLAFAALEGVALGAFSKLIDAMFTGENLVMLAVAGTFAAFAGTLGVYKFFNIQVGSKFRTMVMAGMFGMIGLSLVEMVLGMVGSPIGLFGFGGMGLIFSIAGLALGVFMLVMDFDFVERGVANGIPERESWRAAFALTVSLVWIYTNLLRILAIMNQD